MLQPLSTVHRHSEPILADQTVFFISAIFVELRLAANFNSRYSAMRWTVPTWGQTRIPGSSKMAFSPNQYTLCCCKLQVRTSLLKMYYKSSKFNSNYTTTYCIQLWQLLDHLRPLDMNFFRINSHLPLDPMISGLADLSSIIRKKH